MTNLDVAFWSLVAVFLAFGVLDLLASRGPDDDGNGNPRLF